MSKGIVYVCGQCEAGNCRLWRLYNTFLDSQELRCIRCAERDQGKSCKLFSQEQVGGGDQIGFLIPAVPTEENDTYWGYSSVPPDLVDWWYNLSLWPSRDPREVMTDFEKLVRENELNVTIATGMMGWQLHCKKLRVEARSDHNGDSMVRMIDQATSFIQHRLGTKKSEWPRKDDDW